MATKPESIGSSQARVTRTRKRPRSAAAHEESSEDSAARNQDQAQLTLMAIVSAAHAAGTVARRAAAEPDRETLHSLAFQLDAIALLADAALCRDTLPGTWLIGPPFHDVLVHPGGDRARVGADLSGED